MKGKGLPFQLSCQGSKHVRAVSTSSTKKCGINVPPSLTDGALYEMKKYLFILKVTAGSFFVHSQVDMYIGAWGCPVSAVASQLADAIPHPGGWALNLLRYLPSTYFIQGKLGSSRQT